MASVSSVFFFTSQVKPGPNIAAAVAMKVSRKASIDAKECSMRDVRKVDGVVGVGDRVLKNRWLLSAMEA